MKTLRGRPAATAGLTLIEVLAAMAVLLVGAAASTSLYTLASQMSRRDEAADRARLACRTTAASLLALPFRANDGAPDLLATVFPHADTSRNTPEARFVLAGEDGYEPGSFVTEHLAAGVLTRTVATFVRANGLTFQALPVEKVLGWSGAPGDPSPSGALLVSVSALDGEASDRTDVVATADRDLRHALRAVP